MLLLQYNILGKSWHFQVGFHFQVSLIQIQINFDQDPMFGCELMLQALDAHPHLSFHIRMT